MPPNLSILVHGPETDPVMLQGLGFRVWSLVRGKIPEC